MLIKNLSQTPGPDHSVQDQEPAQGKVRRGTTLMEYLMVLSLIIVVALVGVGYFGQMTNNVATAASTAISKSMRKGS